MKHTLANVRNPEGRLDVLIYQIAGRLIDQLERERNLIGIREHVLPLVEQVIRANLPRHNVIPPEISAALKVYQLNRRPR